MDKTINEILFKSFYKSVFIYILFFIVFIVFFYGISYSIENYKSKIKEEKYYSYLQFISYFLLIYIVNITDYYIPAIRKCKNEIKMYDELIKENKSKIINISKQGTNNNYARNDVINISNENQNFKNIVDDLNKLLNKLKMQFLMIKILIYGLIILLFFYEIYLMTKIKKNIKLQIYMIFKFLCISSIQIVFVEIDEIFYKY